MPLQATMTRVSGWQRVKDLVALGKPRLSALVLFTTAGGIWLAPGRLRIPDMLLTLLSTTLLVWSANALNCYLERDLDARMHRTASRPLPAGRLPASWALVSGLLALVVSLPLLWQFANLLTAALGIVAWLTYVAVYTPMKQRSPWALLVGAIPGAIPPLMGWAARAGTLSWGGFVLFGILFFWQLPHFLAIALYLREDYKRAGIMAFSVAYGVETTKLFALVSCVALAPISLALVPLGLANGVYAFAAALLGFGLTGLGVWRISSVPATKWARQLFLGSLVYLTLLFAAIAVGTGR